MSEARYTNYADVIGVVQSKGFNEKVGQDKFKGKTLGNLTLKVGDDRVYYNLRNYAKWLEAGKNPVQDFFDEIVEGDVINLSGNMTEDHYQDRINRNIEPYISADKGVSYTKFQPNSTVTHKATLMLEGDVLKKSVRYDNLERFDNQPTAILTLRVAYFSFYNRETRKNDLTKVEVLKNELKGYYEYQSSRDETYADLEQVKKWVTSLNEDDSDRNVYEVLNEFYEKEKPRMWNITILNTVAYTVVDDNLQPVDNNDIAIQLLNDVNEYDNVSLGVIISNKMVQDEFGFISGNISELEVKKLNSINIVFSDEELEEVADEEVPW